MQVSDGVHLLPDGAWTALGGSSRPNETPQPCRPLALDRRRRPRTWVRKGRQGEAVAYGPLSLPPDRAEGTGTALLQGQRTIEGLHWTWDVTQAIQRFPSGAVSNHPDSAPGTGPAGSSGGHILLSSRLSSVDGYPLLTMRDRVAVFVARGETAVVAKLKGCIEAEISNALTKWEKDYLGRGSVTVKTYILRDMIIVSLHGILSSAEYALCDTHEGMLSVKRTRTSLVESGVEDLKEIIRRITGEEVKSFFTDLSTRTGERIMVFRLYNDLETKLS
jgi:uncharacterized protein YbcI